MERYINIVDYHQRKNNQLEIFDRHVKDTPTCRYPWTHLVINQFGTTYICQSPAWLAKGVGSLLDHNDFFDLLNSHEAQSIRSEISLGRYSYCNHKICSHLLHNKNLQLLPQQPEDLILLTKDQFTADSIVTTLPIEICFDFDYTCNFKCPSCRTDMINHNQGPLWESNRLLVEKIKHVIIDRYIKTGDPVTFRWAGGEPFVSKAYLELWKYIIVTGNKKIRNIIQTNGSYLSKRTGILLKFLPYINVLRISFDAGTPTTYEKVRANGNWNTLIKNSKQVRAMINNNKFKTKLISDFVVQLDNYQEIPTYIEIAKSIGFDSIQLSTMWNWGTWEMDEFNQLNISDPTHPKHQDLIDILNVYANDLQVNQHVSKA